MQDQGTRPRPQDAGGDQVEAAERVVMSCLLAENDHIWTRAELQRELSDLGVFFVDALEGLQRAGLIDICGDRVRVTRPALRMDQLSP